jgi:hypothetical protein
MTPALEAQLSELRETMELYKTAAEREGRASQCCCLSLALDSLERCSRLVHLAFVTHPPQETDENRAQSPIAAEPFGSKV